MTSTARESRGWTLAYRTSKHANRLHRVAEFDLTWLQANVMSAVAGRQIPGAEIWYVPNARAEASGMVHAEDIGTILSDSGKRLRMIDRAGGHPFATDVSDGPALYTPDHGIHAYRSIGGTDYCVPHWCIVAADELCDARPQGRDGSWYVGGKRNRDPESNGDAASVPEGPDVPGTSPASAGDPLADSEDDTVTDAQFAHALATGLTAVDPPAGMVMIAGAAGVHLAPADLVTDTGAVRFGLDAGEATQVLLSAGVSYKDADDATTRALHTGRADVGPCTVTHWPDTGLFAVQSPALDAEAEYYAREAARGDLAGSPEELLCYQCGGYDGILRAVVALGPVANVADPTQTYKLACGHIGM